MATNKNITMRQFNGVDYDTLYPKTIASQIDDVYSKSETSNLFLPKAGGSVGGILDMNGNKITNLATPTLSSDAATKGYVDKGTNYSFSLDNVVCFAGLLQYRETVDFTGKLTSILSAVVCPIDIQTYSWARIDGLKVSFGTVASTGTFTYIVFGVKSDT
jgi:hypothetical protein|nr:MAG TPA: tail fiber protein [Caudoviricetes sp.]